MACDHKPSRSRRLSRSRRARLAVLSVATLTLGTTALVEIPVSAAAKPKGHDVSSHQKNVNWSKAKSKGAEFAYVKATESHTYRNPYYGQQYHGARNAGLVRGAYHFAAAQVVRQDAGGVLRAQRRRLAGGRLDTAARAPVTSSTPSADVPHLTRPCGPSHTLPSQVSGKLTAVRGRGGLPEPSTAAEEEAGVSPARSRHCHQGSTSPGARNSRRRSRRTRARTP